MLCATAPACARPQHATSDVSVREMQALAAVADALLDAEDDLLAYAAFPKPYWRRI